MRTAFKFKKNYASHLSLGGTNSFPPTSERSSNGCVSLALDSFATLFAYQNNLARDLAVRWSGERFRCTNSREVPPPTTATKEPPQHTIHTIAHTPSRSKSEEFLRKKKLSNSRNEPKRREKISSRVSQQHNLLKSASDHITPVLLHLSCGGVREVFRTGGSHRPDQKRESRVSRAFPRKFLFFACPYLMLNARRVTCSCEKNARARQH